VNPSAIAVRLLLAVEVTNPLFKMKTILSALAVVALTVSTFAATPKAGDSAPKFEATATDGTVLKLADFSGKQAVLLYFYPKDNTPGCTKEACTLRDRMGDLTKQGVRVIGVSRDTDESHKKFIADHKLNFPLIADPDGKLVALFDVGMKDRKMARRVSFLIGKDGKIVHVTDTPSADVHLSEMQEAAAKLAK
jgi:thioredoxin-dependent peroxiredoxin